MRQEMDRLNRIKTNYKHFSCLAVIRNSLAQGNSKVKEVLSKTVHDKSNAFDKILILMLNGCENKISAQETNEVINSLEK